MKNTKASEIANYLGAHLFGEDVAVTSVAPINALSENTFSFAKKFNENNLRMINASKNTFVIVTEDFKDKIGATYIVSDNPRLDFLRVIEHFFTPERVTGIDTTAKIDSRANLGKAVFVGANSVIGPDVTIGEGASIHHNVVILGKVKMGKNCVIKSNAVIGEEGFGFEYSEYGVPEHFPHIGCIEIGDNVWIGAGSTIERGTIDKTVIKNNVKIDDLVQIGHNCVVGENTLVMAGAVLCGGALIGRNCWIAPNTSIREKIKVGDNVLVGLGAVVIADVPEKTTVAGNPAKKLR